MKQHECSHRNVVTKPIKLRVFDQHHRVGCNVPLQSTILETLSQPISEGSHCIQFYLGPQRSYSCRTINSYDREDSIKYCDKYGKTFYVHCPNITNLARDPYNNILINTSNVIKREMYQIRDMPGSCIVHIGAVGTINDVVNNINNLHINRGSHPRSEKQLILENAAGAGSKLGSTWEELRCIYEGIDNNTVGLCIDTQHIFGRGVNPMTNHEDIVKLFDNAKAVYGRNPDVIHLNDSKVTYGSRVDRHWGLGSGYIWHQKDEGLRSLLDYCYDQDIDVILETPTSGQDLFTIRNKYMDLETIDVYLSK